MWGYTSCRDVTLNLFQGPLNHCFCHNWQTCPCRSHRDVTLNLFQGPINHCYCHNWQTCLYGSHRDVTLNSFQGPINHCYCHNWQTRLYRSHGDVTLNLFQGLLSYCRCCNSQTSLGKHGIRILPSKSFRLAYEILIGFVLATAALAISPGPDNIFVLTLSMANGKKYGLAVVAGLMTGCLVHTTLLAFGVSEIIKRSPTIFWVIKIFGALYLLYLAVLVFKEGSGITLSQGNKTTLRLGGLFKKGFWMNVLNPKVTIFFLAFFPGFLFSDSLNTVLQFYILGGLFIVVSSIVFGAIALLAGSISNYLVKTPGIAVFFKWLQIVVFVGIAAYLLLG